MRTPLITGEYYHVYNRGNDKRSVFLAEEDLDRFLFSMREFSRDSISIVAYCLNQNHYHFILKQDHDEGVQRFMHRLGIGYTMYFNNKYKKSGALFQGRYKAKHISSNEYLLHLSAYVNLNFRVHDQPDVLSWRSSWDEYIDQKSPHICSKEMILGQFGSRMAYKDYSEKALEDIRDKKERDQDMRRSLFEG